MKRWMSRVLILVVLVLLVGGGAAWYASARSTGTTSFKTVPVVRGDIVATISATGTVEPEEVIDVGAQVAGRILEFGKDRNGKPIDYRSQVEEGTVLARIDDAVYQSDVASATAQLDMAKAGVTRSVADLEQLKAKLYQAERDWERAQTLDPKTNALAATQYDAYKAAFDGAKANVGVGESAIVQAKATVAQAQAALDRAKRNLGYCTIVSPVKGTIIDRRVNIGQTVVASLNAPSLFLLAKDLTRVQVWASVNEADISNIQPGQLATFTVDGFPNRVFEGHVGKVRFNAQMTQNVVTYTVEVIADNSDGALIPYRTANVTFHVDKHTGTLMVPSVALRWSPTNPEQVSPDAQQEQGGGRDEGAERGGSTRPAGAGATTRKNGGADRPQRGTLWVEDGNFLRPVRVRLGLTDGTNVEVFGENVQEGMAVVIGENAPGAAGGDDAKNPFVPQFRPGGGSGRRGGR